MHHRRINGSSYLLGRPVLERSIKHSSNFHQILLVGEGDFSFSSALANAFGSAENMVVTSLDSRGLTHFLQFFYVFLWLFLSYVFAVVSHFILCFNFYIYVLDAEKLLQLYGVESAHNTLSNLERLGATILHGVDATTMENHHLIRRTKFHRIVYNFPHAGFYGKEENENVIEFVS